MKGEIDFTEGNLTFLHIERRRPRRVFNLMRLFHDVNHFAGISECIVKSAQFPVYIEQPIKSRHEICLYKNEVSNGEQAFAPIYCGAPKKPHFNHYHEYP